MTASGPRRRENLPLKHSKQIDSVKFSHCSTRILTCSHDGTVRIWYHSKQWKSKRLPLEEYGTVPPAFVQFERTQVWALRPLPEQREGPRSTLIIVSVLSGSAASYLCHLC